LDKPDAAPVRLALEQSGIDPGETVWFVGDTGIDMECAHNSGCVPVLLGSGMTQEEFGGCPPRFVFSDCLTLFRFVQGLCFIAARPSSSRKLGSVVRVFVHLARAGPFDSKK